MKATDILWAVDCEEDLEFLPTEIDIPDGMEDEEEIADYISDVTGFCHYGFELNIMDKKENMSPLLEEVIEKLECCDIEPTKENIKKQINEYIKNLQSHIGTEAHNHSMECGVENLTGMTWDEMDKVMLQQIEEYKSCLKELEQEEK